MTRARPILRFLSLLAALLAIVAAAPATAQGASGGKNIRVTLVADGPPVAGKPWTLALHFVPTSPAWHGYWNNPGDAGAEMRLDWSLPAGWTAGEPRYPVPRTLVVAGLMNHVFEGEHTVLVPVTIPEGAVAGPVGLKLDYLACTDQICVPERAELVLDPRQAPADPRFSAWRAALAPPLDRAAHFAVSGNLLRLAVPLPASLGLPAPHVFVDQRELVKYAGQQAFARKGDLLIAEMPLADDAVVPSAVSGILAFDTGSGVRFSAQPGAVPDDGTPLRPDAQPAGSLAWLILAALAGGLLLNIMPCVFPILSLKAMALARAGGDERQARRDALGYTAGVVVACLALGGAMLILRAGGEQVGWAFQLQEPGVVVALLVLAVAIAANFAGFFELPSLAFAGKGGGGGSFLTGLLAAFVATPCTGPFMAAAMGAALLLPPAEALVLFGALGLGLALPFLLLGFVPALRRMMPKPGRWMEVFRRAMAVPMALTAAALVWLLWRLGGPGFAAVALGLALLVTLALRMFWSDRQGPYRRAQLAGAVAASLAALVVLPQLFVASAGPDKGLLDAKPFSEVALASARASGKPVFVYFTADWCLTCKVNESAAIERAATRDAFREGGVTVLVGDWTRRDEAITRFLTAQGAAGVPLYLWYPAGQANPRQLPQVLTPGLLAELARGSG